MCFRPIGETGISLELSVFSIAFAAKAKLEGVKRIEGQVGEIAVLKARSSTSKPPKAASTHRKVN